MDWGTLQQLAVFVVFLIGIVSIVGSVTWVLKHFIKDICCKSDPPKRPPYIPLKPSEPIEGLLHKTEQAQKEYFADVKSLFAAVSRKDDHMKTLLKLTEDAQSEYFRDVEALFHAVSSEFVKREVCNERSDGKEGPTLSG